MQQSPLLEQFDWFFTSVNWSNTFPNTLALPLARTTSDHIPCKVSIGTSIPRSNIFCFENFWPEHPGFFEIVQAAWSKPTRRTDSALTLSTKFKRLRYDLKYWSKKLSNLAMLIEKCNKMIFYMDSLEECRRLTDPEWNFRVIIKNHLSSLLKYRKIYWQKRYTVNRIRFGDECTKFFHTMATVNFRRNAISSLRDDHGNIITDHDGKAALLYVAFKNRMGITTQPEMQFDLHSLINVDVYLSFLVQPFTRDEIDLLVRKLPVDKAPGPNGFNGLFIKKCWNVIKEDFYKLCEDFFSLLVNLESINSSFITLVAKVHSPETVNDYRPISVLNMDIKLLTKLLADRLHMVILQLLHANQYGFIRTRTIQDCLAWCFEYIHQCQ